MSCGVGHRPSSDLALLWLWCRLAVAAPIQLLAWELPYSTGYSPKQEKRKKKEVIHINRTGQLWLCGAYSPVKGERYLKHQGTGEFPMILHARLVREDLSGGVAFD